jgi:hypothetical protein
MTDLWRRYQQLKIPRPATNLTWPLSGVGLAHFGREGRPVAEPMPRCGPAEILVRVDAVGICSSDAKMIRLGAGYPLFYGRDLARQPARLGHEVALTVIEVGQRWQGHYRPGQRLGLQPDVFVQGQRRCFGVLLPGGFCQYLSLGAEVLAGDAGSYVFPVPDALAYADIALLEPWACVEAAYSPRRRLELHPNGLLWIKGWPGDDRPYSMSRPRPGGTVILSDVPESFAAWVRGQPVEWLSRDGAAGPALLAELGRPAFDDIILLNSPDARSVAAAAGHLAAQGTLTIVRSRPMWGASTTSSSPFWVAPARISARPLARPATAPNCGPAGSPGLPGPAGQWAACTCNGPCKWPMGRGRSSSPIGARPAWPTCRLVSPPWLRPRAAT